jgi:hypothetical protein
MSSQTTKQAAAAVSLADAAAELELDVATVRRWIQAGAPCDEPGSAGRGKGARVRVDALRRWRRSREAEAPAPAALGIMRLLAASFYAFHQDGRHHLAGMRDAQAAAYLHDLAHFVAWQAGLELELDVAELKALEKIARSETAQADERFCFNVEHHNDRGIEKK